MHILIAVSLLAGCSGSHRDLAAGDDLVSAYAELILVREEFRQRPASFDSTSYQQRVREILSKRGLTEEELSDRLTDLAQSQEAFQRFQSLVREELEKSRPKTPLSTQ
jgi:hypothetical protein